MLTRYERNTLDPFALFDRSFFGPSYRRTAEPAEPRFLPAVDIKFDEGAYRIEAELPGVKAEDISVEVEKNVLLLKGSRSETKVSEEDGVSHRERTFGSFERRFTLPDTADGEHVEAHLADGVLTLRVPKKPEVVPRKVDVKVLAKAPDAED